MYVQDPANLGELAALKASSYYALGINISTEVSSKQFMSSRRGHMGARTLYCGCLTVDCTNSCRVRKALR